MNPFTEQEATNARQAYLAQEAKLATAEAQAQQIQSQLDAIVSGECHHCEFEGAAGGEIQLAGA